MPARSQDLPAMEGPGVGQVRIKEIDAAAEDYVSARDKRMRLTEKEVASKTVLTELMKKHDLTRYVYDEQEVICEPGTPVVKVRQYNPETNPEQGED